MTLLMLAACTGTKDPGQSTCDGDIHTETLSLESDKNGLVEIPVAVDGNDDAFMVHTARSSGSVSTDVVVDGDGNTVLDWEDWSTSHDSLTNAFYASTDVSVLNWPIRESDPALTRGDWLIYASTLDNQGYYKGNEAVDVTVIRRSCGGGSAGLPVTIVYAGGIERDRVVTDAVEAAADRWVEIYGAYGLDLTIEYASADIDGSVPEPIVGDDSYASIYDAFGKGVVVVVGEDVAGEADLYGEAGGVPGPLIASEHSVVAVSWLIHAGPDASFSNDEIEVFAETMAHEAGHYLGLFHPVEIDWTYWDALDDTKACTSTAACERALGSNLMFPYPVCDASCVEQSSLSAGQVGVLNLNVGVR